MPKPDPNHIHKFKRHYYSTKKAIYFCVNDCPFRVDIKFALGRVSQCWRCNKPFPMNSYSITLDKPHCEDCHQHKGDKLVGRRKGLRRQSDQPLTKVADAVGNSLVIGLKDRLAGALTAEGNEPKLMIREGAEKILNEIKEIKQIKVIEYEIKDDEDYL